MKRFLSVFLILLTFCISNLYSQDSEKKDLIEIIENSYSANEPTWLLMERGRQAFDIGEYGLASRVFREVLNRGDNPDAEIWLAYIFEQEGEYQLAEKQYLKALKNHVELYIIEDEIAVLYRLAEIYRKTDQYGKYEKILLRILDKDDNDGILQLQYSMLDAAKEQGIDKMFELYRYENTKFIKARIELGVFYYKTGRYTESEINLILPIISAATTGYNYIYNKTADYEYYNFDLHVSNMLDENIVSDFLRDNEFFKAVYYLASSLYADGHRDSAQKLWLIVYRYDDSASTWKARAERQLQKPFIEPIITHRT